MTLIADIFLIAGSLGAAFYCIVLSRKLSKLSRLEDGMGGAISVLSAQVSDMTRALDRAQSTAAVSSQSLQDVTERSEAAAKRLEILLASLHDLPPHPGEPSGGNPEVTPTFRRRPRAQAGAHQ